MYDHLNIKERDFIIKFSLIDLNAVRIDPKVLYQPSKSKYENAKKKINLNSKRSTMQNNKNISSL